VRANPLIFMVRLAGIEPTTPWFVARKTDISMGSCGTTGAVISQHNVLFFKDFFELVRLIPSSHDFF